MFVDPCILVQFLQKNPTRCNNVSKFYYSIFVWSSTCFGRHIAHHQKPKTALAASGFSHVEGCWTCRWWTLSGTLCLTKYVFCACAITFQTQKDEIWFLRVCHHISNAVRRNLISAHVPSHSKRSKTKSGFCACAITFQKQSTRWIPIRREPRNFDWRGERRVDHDTKCNLADLKDHVVDGVWL